MQTELKLHDKVKYDGDVYRITGWIDHDTVEIMSEKSYMVDQPHNRYSFQPKTLYAEISKLTKINEYL